MVARVCGAGVLRSTHVTPDDSLQRFVPIGMLDCALSR